MLNFDIELPKLKALSSNLAIGIIATKYAKERSIIGIEL